MSLDSTFAVLDACVLLPPRLSDVLMDCRAEGLFSAHWTEEIRAEYLRNMQGALGYPEAAAARRLVAMERRCPEWSVPAWRAKLPSVPDGVDAKDQHVAAAALALRTFLDTERIAAEVFVVTENTRHLATKSMKRLGVDVVRAGRFLDLMYGQDPDKVHNALRRAVEDLRDPPYSMEQLLGALEFHGAHGLVKGASQALGIAPTR